MENLDTQSGNAMPLSPAALIAILKAMPELREVLHKEFDSVREAQDYAFDVNSHIVSEGIMAKVKLNVDKKKWMIVLDELEYTPPLSEIKRMIVLTPEERELIRKGIIPSVVYAAAYKRELERVRTNQMATTTPYKPSLIAKDGEKVATDTQRRINEYMDEVMPFMLGINLGRELSVINWSRNTGMLPLIRNMEVRGSKQPLKVEDEKDIEDFMSRRGKYSRGYTKGTIGLFATLNDKKEYPEYIIADFDIEGEDPLSDDIIEIIQRAYGEFMEDRLKSGILSEPKIMFTGNGWHIITKILQQEINYEMIKTTLIDTAKKIGIPAGVLGAKGTGISLDYASSSYRRPWRFPLSIHHKTGFAAIFISPDEMKNVTKWAYPTIVLKNLDTHTDEITEFFLS